MATKKNSKLIKIIMLIVVAVALLVGGYFVWGSFKDNKLVDTSVEAQDKVRLEYEDLLHERKFDEAENLVKDSILVDSEKENLLKQVEKMRSGREDALKKLLAQEGTDDFNYGAAKTIGEIYAYRGEKNKAKDYYELSIELLKKTDNSMKEEEIMAIQGRMKELNEK